MNTYTLKPELIEKEAISDLHFPKTELPNAPDRRTLMMKLNRATILGNIEHRKIKIVFMDDSNIKSVTTTIWATGQNYVVLKKGVTIPIERIVDVII